MKYEVYRNISALSTIVIAQFLNLDDAKEFVEQCAKNYYIRPIKK